MLLIHCRTHHGSYHALPTTWSANVARVYLCPNPSEEPADRSISLHALPFLRILVAACAHSRAMSNAILANRLVRAVIPYLTKSILPQSETKSAEATDASGPSRWKGKKRARGYEGDEIFKTNPGVLLGSPGEERVVMLSIEGESAPLSPCEEGLTTRSVTVVVTRHGDLVGDLLSIIKTSTLVAPSPLEASALPRIQGPHIPRGTFDETSKCVHRARFYEIRGAGENSATIDEPLRPKRNCSFR